MNTKIDALDQATLRAVLEGIESIDDCHYPADKWQFSPEYQAGWDTALAVITQALTERITWGAREDNADAAYFQRETLCGRCGELGDPGEIPANDGRYPYKPQGDAPLCMRCRAKECACFLCAAYADTNREAAAGVPPQASAAASQTPSGGTAETTHTATHVSSIDVPVSPAQEAQKHQSAETSVAREEA